MRKYLTILRASLQSSLAYREHYLFLMLGNAIYIVVTWFLWKSIFAGSESLNGMSFGRTFTYLVLAMSIFVLLQTWCEWGMSRRIISGDIVVDFLRPLDYMAMQLFDILGFVASNFVAITLPSFLIVVVVFGMPIPLGINLPLCLVSLCLAFLISYCIDFIVGIAGFYTESIWGVSMTKEVIVLALSGALVPVKFYPEAVQRVLEWLPFQAIYNIPLNILLGGGLGASDYLRLLGVQAAWIVILIGVSRAFFMKASKVITVNGG